MKKLKYVYLVTYIYQNENISGTGSTIIYRANKIDCEAEVKLVDELGMSQIGDEDEIKAICEEVMNENPTAKEQYLAGKTNILDFLVGQVMKKTRGKANPATTRETMKSLIEN